MATETQTAPAIESPVSATAPLPDLKQVAAQIAAKHSTTGAKSNGKVNKGGRRTVAEEAQAYLRANNLRAVPESAPDQTQAPLVGGYAVDPEFVRNMAKMALEATEAWRQRATYLKATAIGADKELARELAEGNGAPPGAIEVISRSLAEISQKYGWLSQWCPEIAVVVAAGAWFSKDMSTMKRLEAIHRENKAIKEAKTV